MNALVHPKHKQHESHYCDVCEICCSLDNACQEYMLLKQLNIYNVILINAVDIFTMEMIQQSSNT